LLAAEGTHFGQSEVENFGVTAIGDEEISRLYIAMDNSLVVRGIKGVGNFDAEIEQRLEFKPASEDGLTKSLSLEILHGYKGTALVLANLVDGVDIGMIQRRGGTGLAAEAFKCLLISGNVIR